MKSKYNFSKKRTECPICHSHDGFAAFTDGRDFIGNGEFGHCHSCGNTIFPDAKENEPFYYEKINNSEPYEVPKFEFDSLKGAFSDVLRIRLIDKDPRYMKILKKYQIVSFGQTTGFPLIDRGNHIRSIKKMVYGDDLHRVKDGTKSAIGWYHSGRINENQYFENCFFGENLINSSVYEHIGIVESEKTAVVASLFVKNVLFLACGSKTNIKQLIYKGLKDKNLILYPDADGYADWKAFVAAQKKSNWKISKVCANLANKQDICDVLLSPSAEEWAKNLNDEIYQFFVNTKANRDEAKKIKYYEILHTKFSIGEFYDLLEKYGIDSAPFSVNYNEKTYSLKIESKESSNDSIFLIFKRAGKIDDFHKLIESLHVPKFENTLDFSFNFTDEDFEKYIENESPCFFDNIIFDIIKRRYVRQYDEEFCLKSHIQQCLENLYSSSLNEQHRKLTKKKIEFVDNFIEDFENKELEKINVKKVLPQNYNEILERGQKCLDDRGITDDDFQYWVDLFNGLWEVTEYDVEGMILFCSCSIRRKFFDDLTCGKLIQITGKSNTGKDSFIPSLFLGEWILKSEHAHQGGLFNKGFLAISKDRCKSLMYNIVSDDIMAANEIGELSKITDFNIVCNSKYGGIVKIRNSWNKIVSNNNARITMNKKTDKAAQARRFCFCNINYKIGCGIRDYQDYFLENTERFYDIYAAFFTFCYNFAQNPKFKELQKKITNENIEKVASSLYMNNDDEIICENFVSFLTKIDDDPSLQSDNEQDGVFFVKKGEELYYYFRCDWSQFSPKLQKSKDYILNQTLRNCFNGLRTGVARFSTYYKKTIRYNVLPQKSVLEYQQKIYETQKSNENSTKKQINILEIWEK